MWLQRAAALLSGEADLRREIARLAGLESGTLAVGAGPFAAEISVAGAVGRLLRRHPRLRVRLLTADAGDVVRAVLAGELDAGIVSIHRIGEPSRLRVEPLPSHRVYLACRPGHPLADGRALALSDVLGYPFAAPVLAGDAAAEAFLNQLRDVESEIFGAATA